MWLEIFIENGAHESPYSDYAVQTGFFFTCKRIDHHTLCTVLPWHIQILAEKTKVTIQGSIWKKKRERERDHKSLFHNCHACTRDKINSCHVRWYKPDKKSCHASFVHLRTHSAVRLYTTGKEAEDEGQRGRFTFCCALLRGISCFDSK